MSQKRRSNRSSSTLAPRDINLARELVSVSGGRLGALAQEVQEEQVTSIIIDEEGGLKQECDKDVKTLSALFVLLQINASVRHLEIKGVNLESEWILKTLAAAISLNTTTKTLVIKDANIDADGVSILANSLKRSSNISELNISGNPLGDDGAFQLCGALRNNVGLRKLTLEHNNFTDKGLLFISKLLPSAALTHLYLGGNRFSFGKEAVYDKEAEQMCRAPEKLGEALEENTSLRVLDFNTNEEVIKSFVAPLFDSLKLNRTLTHLDLEFCQLTNRVFFILAEYCVAKSKETILSLNLKQTGANASILREVSAFRILDHNITLHGVTFGRIATAEENKAQLCFLVHLINRPHGRIFPHSARKDFLLKDGRTASFFTNPDGSINSGHLEYPHGDSLSFSIPPSSTVINKEERVGHSYPSSMTRVPLQGTYEMSTTLLRKATATIACLLSIADFVLDITVISQLASNGNWTAFWISLAGLAWAHAYTCSSLISEERRIAAALHVVGLSMVPDAFYFVLREKKPNATVILQSTQPMQGLAAIHRLKLLQSLLEAAPQLLFQTFVLLYTRVSVTLILSIALSVISVVGTTTQSDRNKIKAWSNVVEKDWISTISISVLFFASFRTTEVLSNISTIAFAMAYFPISPAITVGAVVGSKLLLTIVYWRGNVSHFGEVFSSIFIAPGTTKITYDWVKNVQRLGIWYYIGLQLLYDFTILLLLGLLDGVTIDNALYFAGIGCVLAKYTMAGILWAMHNYCLVAMYTDRRNILTCGFVTTKQSGTPEKTGSVQFRMENPVKQRNASLAKTRDGIQSPDPSSSRSLSITSSPRKSVGSEILNDYPSEVV